MLAFYLKLEPFKMSFVLTENNRLMIIKFTATVSYKPKRIPYTLWIRPVETFIMIIKNACSRSVSPEEEELKGQAVDE